MRTTHDGFKCRALCLYLPGFGGGKVMSRIVSLENFECGSCSSAAIPNEIEGDFDNTYKVLF